MLQIKTGTKQFDKRVCVCVKAHLGVNEGFMGLVMFCFCVCDLQATAEPSSCKMLLKKFERFAQNDQILSFFSDRLPCLLLETWGLYLRYFICIFDNIYIFDPYFCMEKRMDSVFFVSFIP